MEYIYSKFHLLIYSLLFIAVFFLNGCKEKNTRRNGEVSLTQAEWPQKAYHFGDISEGEIVTHTFYIKNVGKNHLLIKKVDSGCGCTTVTYDKAPLAPGKERKIEIAFNSEGRYGKQYKEISIFANIPEKEMVLGFTANVKE